MNKVTVSVAGVNYTFATDNDSDYAKELAAEVDGKIQSVMTGARYVLPDQAIILTLLDYADMAHKATLENEKLRLQLKEYLADTAQAKSERDMLKRELARLKKNNGEAKI